MPQDTRNPTEHEESILDRVLDHHHKNRNEPQDDNFKDKDKSPGHESSLRDDMKKDEAGLKKYVKEDEKLEEEGQTYGGLM